MRARNPKQTDKVATRARNHSTASGKGAKPRVFSMATSLSCVMILAGDHGVMRGRDLDAGWRKRGDAGAAVRVEECGERTLDTERDLYNG